MLLRAGFNEYFNDDESLKSKTISKDEIPNKESGDEGESVSALKCIDNLNAMKNSELFNWLSLN